MRTIGLHRVERPNPGGRNALVHDTVRLIRASACLLRLACRQIEIGHASRDVLPGEERTDGLIELAPPRFVGGEHDERVRVLARCSTPIPSEVQSKHPRRGFLPPRVVGVQGVRNHQAAGIRLGEIGGSQRTHHDIAELGGATRSQPQPAQGLSVDILLMQRRGALPRHAIQRRLPVEPIPLSVGIEVGGTVSEHLQRRAEVTDRVAGHGNAEENLLALNTLMSATESRGGPHEERSCDPPGESPGAEQRTFAVDVHGGGILAIDVGLDDRLPRIIEVRAHFVPHCRR